MRILTTAKNLYCRAPFVEELSAEHLLVEHFSMAASIKSKIIDRNLCLIFMQSLIDREKV